MLTRLVTSGCAVALVAITAAATVSAQDMAPMDKRTYVTFSAPVEMPGTTLPAGKYTFRILNPNTTQSAVQVLDGDGTKVFGTFFTVRAERQEPKGDAEIRFIETPAGSPPAVGTWWFAGDVTGREFIYPRQQATRLARAANTSVLTTKSESTTAEQTNTSDLTRVSPTGEESEVATTDVTPAEKDHSTAAESQASATSGTPQQQPGTAQPSSIGASGMTPSTNETVGTTGQASGSQQPSTTTPAPRERSRLPRTASTTPLVALTGALALFGAIGLRLWRRADASNVIR